ncbi:uncharacterized protein LOC126678346 [Mercurialis annua]|uniref:uncharacterized protein LOC126678346 n=1 Tax=Mercurialis annua TaxID=3986 RepID=UPI00215F0F47|nr:uncharacterized protein LOC126678346 [Mercurialis annua]
MAEGKKTETSGRNKHMLSGIMAVSHRITDHKLIGASNYVDWSTIVTFYLWGIRKSRHLTDEPKTHDEDWMANDACLLLGIKNSIDAKIVSLVRHCGYCKQIMDYLKSLYLGKGNVSHLYDTYKSFYTTDPQGQSIHDYYMQLKDTFEQLNELLPLSTYITVLQAQREQMFVLRFLCGLSSEYEGVTSQILSRANISDGEEALTRIWRSNLVLLATPSVPPSTALYSRRHTFDRSFEGPTRGSTRDMRSPNDGSRSVEQDMRSPNDGSRSLECFYCHEPGHTKRTCPLLKVKEKRYRSAQVATNEFTPSAPSTAQSYTLTTDEYACQVINYGATNHMTGNYKLFTSYNKTFPSHVTVANGAQSSVTISGTINPTSLLSLSTIDLMTKQVIGSGRESGGLYVLETTVRRPVACSTFQKLSSLDCKSCQFAKHHRLTYVPRVNKRSNFPFELVHFDVWGPYSVVSKPVHTSRSHNAKEYLSGPFQIFMSQNSILHQTSCVDTPSQNGLAERKNRHLLETARVLLFQTQVPKYFWIDAVSTTCFFINRMRSAVLNELPVYYMSLYLECRVLLKINLRVTRNDSHG